MEASELQEQVKEEEEEESMKPQSGERPHDEEMGPLMEERLREVRSQVGRRVEEVVAYMEECLEGAGPRLERCIGEVRVLELQRDVLVAQLLQLEQPMARAVQLARAELSQARKHLARAELERRGLQEQVRQVKRQLFLVARDCIQSQVTLATKQHEVAQCTITQEELTTQIQELKEEVSRLQEEQRDHLKEVRERARAPGRRRRPCSDLTYCRRLSLDLQQHLRGGVQALEQRYEPRLLALLRRRQWGEEALRKQREETLDLKARLQPLREQTQALELQRACLGERVALVERDRDENVAQYRETLEVLEQTLRDLRTEVQVQKKRNEGMENLKNSLSKELDVHRKFVEVYGTLQIPAEKRPETESRETLHR